MRAGSLRHKVVIQTPTVTKDKYGATVTTWTDYRSVRASIEQMKAFDRAAVAATWPGADKTVTLRYVAGLTGNMRVLHGPGCPCGIAVDEILSILGTPNNVDGRNREMVLTCQSGLKSS